MEHLESPRLFLGMLSSQLRAVRMGQLGLATERKCVLPMRGKGKDVLSRENDVNKDSEVGKKANQGAEVL